MDRIAPLTAESDGPRMPFFIIDVTHSERADGSLRLNPTGGTVAYPTAEAATAAVATTAGLRQRRREGWARAYDRPFPGADYHIVEAPDSTTAHLHVLGLPAGATRGQIRLGTPVRIGLHHGEDMPPAVRAAYDRLTQPRPPPQPNGEDATVAAFEAYYRWEREMTHRAAERAADLEAYTRWRAEHPREPTT